VRSTNVVTPLASVMPAAMGVWPRTTLDDRVAVVVDGDRVADVVAERVEVWSAGSPRRDRSDQREDRTRIYEWRSLGG
jgi:hypothetical protein